MFFTIAANTLGIAIAVGALGGVMPARSDAAESPGARVVRIVFALADAVLFLVAAIVCLGTVVLFIIAMVLGPLPRLGAIALLVPLAAIATGTYLAAAITHGRRAPARRRWQIAAMVATVSLAVDWMVIERLPF